MLCLQLVQEHRISIPPSGILSLPSTAPPPSAPFRTAYKIISSLRSPSSGRRLRRLRDGLGCWCAPSSSSSFFSPTLPSLLRQRLFPVLLISLLSSPSCGVLGTRGGGGGGTAQRCRWTRRFQRRQQQCLGFGQRRQRPLCDAAGFLHPTFRRPLFGSSLAFAATTPRGGGDGGGGTDKVSRMSSDFRKLESPSADRNKEPIWTLALEPSVLPPILDGLAAGTSENEVGEDKPMADDPNVLRVLEVAAGAGVHTQYFALKILDLLKTRQQWVDLRWYPTDASLSALDSQRAYRDEHRDVLASVVQEPLPLTLSQRGIGESDTYLQFLQVGSTFHVILCINMVHIAPWSATLGLFQVASQFLHPDPNARAALVLYGPFRVNGSMVESNVRFDGWLKSQDPQYGVRNLEDVVQVARQIADLVLDETIEMPANNLCLVFRRRQST